MTADASNETSFDPEEYKSRSDRREDDGLDELREPPERARR